MTSRLKDLKFEKKKVWKKFKTEIRAEIKQSLINCGAFISFQLPCIDFVVVNFVINEVF